MDKTNCFAYLPETKERKSECKALRFKNCENCRFYKSKSLYETELQKSYIKASYAGYYDGTDEYQPLKNEWSV